jgi:hypothetical protein
LNLSCLSGIGGGLLQRVCFFGQHSHTLHSLLGLTDIKLKNELSSLVDTTVWVNALQDVRGREKQEKNRISDLLVEIRIRKEEIGRCQTDIDARLLASAELQLEIETAKQKGKLFQYPARSDEKENDLI